MSDITLAEITLAELNTASREAFVAALANIFEYSPWVAEAAADRRPFASVAQLFEAMATAVEAGSEETRLALIRAHPGLGDKTQRAAGLTPESHSEQNSAGLDRLSDAEFEAFERANGAYVARFGFPYVVCVRRHTKDSILRDVERRLPNDPTTEARVSIGEICRIAALRVDQFVKGDGRLSVNGALTTHVLDTARGLPAQGVAIRLVELSSLGEPRLIASTATNHDGRTDAPLIQGRPLPMGRYELVFDVGDYFARHRLAVSDPPFLDSIPIRFAIAEPEGHLHVPLLVTPWSYGTYRGS